MKINTISTDKNKYLQIICTVADYPKRFYFRGTLPSERIISVAIIGSRKPTSYGKEVTYRLASDLSKYGIVIVSGLAFGIDAIAHKAAIDSGGITIAVLGNGLDTIYPAANYSLAQDIINKNGAIVSEYPPGIEARSFQFLKRNRIVSGLSDAIIVTEATLKSGTMSTVAHALEQGRDVFVVPGNITSPLSTGCNKLIKQGAHPITCAEDVIEVIAPELLKRQLSIPLGSNPLETKILQLIQSGIRNGEELQIKTDVEISEFSQTLTMMEISGLIRPLGGNQWVIK